MFVLIAKDLFKTRFMQACDVFEPFKFVGILAKIKKEIAKTPREYLLELLQKPFPDDQYAMVGLIVPGVGAAIVDGNKVISDGECWTTVEDLCGRYNASNIEYVGKGVHSA